MNSIRLFNRQTGLIVMAAALLFATFIPALVSAAQVTNRSVELSSSSVSATGVTYKVNFTAVQAAGAFVVEFCSNTPVLGQSCTPPTGFTSATVSTPTAGFTAAGTTNKVTVTGTINASDVVSVDVTGITNPSTTDPLYARIVTYTDGTDAAGYTSANPDVVGAHKDDGGVAIAITPTVGVSGAVLETLTFCVSKALPTASCAGADSPVLTLGETVGSVVALSSSAVSTGVLNTQISTNAVGGAVVRLKSATDCGGLKRVGASVCDIVPALTGDITAGQAKFGVKTATATDTPSTTANGAFQPVTGSGYGNTAYALNYLANNSSGVTSAFGDPFLDTNSAPANNKNMALTFGASIGNDTPAGLYSTNLSLIATGKF